MGLQLQHHRAVEEYSHAFPQRPHKQSGELKSSGGRFAGQRFGGGQGAERGYRQRQFYGDDGRGEEEEEAAEHVLKVEFKRKPPCVLCQGDHGLGRCNKFREMKPQDRYDLLIREKRCLLCFQRGHVVARCSFTFTCAT